MTQKDFVLELMKTGKPITQKEAYEVCGTQRLSAIIFKLRKMGYNIYNIPSKSITRFGNTCNFVKYFLSNTVEELQAIENASA